jgi:hypothetical protein
VEPGRFVFALFDLDNGLLPGQEVVPFVSVVGTSGARRTGKARWLPVTWTRAAVDLDDWPEGELIEALEVGVLWTGELDLARGPAPAGSSPSSCENFVVRIGETGMSSAKRTW